MFTKNERDAIDAVIFNLNELRVKLIDKSWTDTGLNMRENTSLNQIRAQIEFWEQTRFNDKWG